MTELPHHRLDGPAEAAPLILGPSLGTSLAVWEPQLAALAGGHRVLRWDLPGHGGSPADLVPTDGSATVSDLAGLVLRLADAQGWSRFRYAGISLGGAVGLHLAVHHQDRITALAVVCSSAHFGEAGPWRERAGLVRAEGTGAMAASRPGTWFAPDLAATPHGAALLADLRATDRVGYAACCDALATYDLRAELPSVTVPTLVVAGRNDPAAPPAHAREIADAVPDATLLEVAGAAHLAGVERPEPVTAALVTHLAPAGSGHGAAPAGHGVAPAGTTDRGRDAVHGDTADANTAHSGTTPGDTADASTSAAPGGSGAVTGGTADRGSAPAGRQAPPADDASRHAAGMAARRAVLGDAHVDRAVAGTTPFTARFQDFITRYAWGEIWTSDILDQRVRRCITLTALVARGHQAELAMHLRAALAGGMTREEIGEVLLQSAVYCGVPAANSAFAVASRVLDELDAADRSAGEAAGGPAAGPDSATGPDAGARPTGPSGPTGHRG